MTIYDQIQNSTDDIETLFGQAVSGLLLVDRKLKVKRVNCALQTMVGKTEAAILHKTIGEALVCIHTGDHADGCGYGSICDNCFLIKAIRQSFKTKSPVEEVVGRLAVGIDGQLKRLPMKITVVPVTFENFWHALVYVIPE